MPLFKLMDDLDSHRESICVKTKEDLVKILNKQCRPEGIDFQIKPDNVKIMPSQEKFVDENGWHLHAVFIKTKIDEQDALVSAGYLSEDL